MVELTTLAWPLERLGEAVEVLARRAGLNPVAAAGPSPSMGLDGQASVETIGRWLDWACARVGVEAESVEAKWADLSTFVQGAAPALLRLGEQNGMLLLLRGGRRRVSLIGPDLRIHHYPTGLLRASLTAGAADPIVTEIQSLLKQARIAERQWPKVTDVLVRERLGDRSFEGCWLLRMPPTRDFCTQLHHAGLPRRLAVVLVVFAGLYLLEVLGWLLLGRGALRGNFDPGWLLAWLLLLVSIVPLRLVGTWLQGNLAIQAGTLLKQRLLSGALGMDVDQIRQQGSGRLLGLVIESQAFDSLVASGGLTALFALIEMAVAGWILSAGAGGLFHAGLLLIWLALTLAASWHYYRRLRQWTHARFDLTEDLVERMVGHRTRLAQEPPERRHADEDPMLARFLKISGTFDRAYVPLSGGLPRGWLVLGLLGLVPEFVIGGAEATGLAVGLGGVLLAYRAFGETASGLAALTRASVAWEYIGPLFNAAKPVGHAPILPLSARAATERDGVPENEVLIQVRDLAFRYGAQAEPVVQGCDLTIRRGDKLLLEGPSGSGKSTLAALLVGLRQPEAGVLLLDGLDRASWGDYWRQMSTSAPQFHENHVLKGTLAFNLLMGRCWPPSAADLAEAGALCDELGLGELLSRMPAGLLQIVGETGWQLSHGEMSRLFLARALLQKSRLVVLDESFAALDPETLAQCLRCALSRAPSVLVIAHP